MKNNQNQQDLFGGISKKEFWETLEKGEDMKCPCCERYSKIYRRPLNATTAFQLIKLYKMSGEKRDYIYIEDLPMRGGGDFTKAAHWGLIEPKPHTTDAKKSSGFWRLTNDGILFVKGEKTIIESIIVFDNEVRRFEGKMVSINDVISVKFNYQELMAATP